MKCHYVNDSIAGRVLIPGCMGAAVHGKDGCTCNRRETIQEHIVRLEREIAEREQELDLLKNEVRFPWKE